MINKYILVLALMAFNSACFAGEPFDVAAARAKTDSAKPINAMWVSAMTESIGTSLGKAFTVCLMTGPRHPEDDLSLVLDVMPDGRVAKVWTASESVFANCLAGEVTDSTYPRPPAEAYFALIQGRPLTTSPMNK